MRVGSQVKQRRRRGGAAVNAKLNAAWDQLRANIQPVIADGVKNVPVRRGGELLIVVLLAVAASAGVAAQVVKKTAAYDDFILGNTTDVSPKTKGGLQLEGGGTDQPEAFAWLIDHAGGGDIVVIRASGTDAYNPFIAKIGKTNSVETIVFHERSAASDPAVLERLRRAEAVFLAGGDQGNYIKYWKDTPVEDTLNRLAAGCGYVVSNQAR